MYPAGVRVRRLSRLGAPGAAIFAPRGGKAVSPGGRKGAGLSSSGDRGFLDGWCVEPGTRSWSGTWSGYQVRGRKKPGGAFIYERARPAWSVSSPPAGPTAILGGQWSAWGSRTPFPGDRAQATGPRGQRPGDRDQGDRDQGTGPRGQRPGDRAQGTETGGQGQGDRALESQRGPSTPSPSSPRDRRARTVEVMATNGQSRSAAKKTTVAATRRTGVRMSTSNPT